MTFLSTLPWRIMNAMGDGTMHWVLLGVGVVLDLIGTIWLLQGINILPGSFMTGQPFWAGAGIAAIIVGMGLVILAMRRRSESA
jgi:hypothetical protein